MQRRSPELPTLDDGVTLLESDQQTTGALHSLVLDHVLVESGDAVWVDAMGQGTTRPMARLAPNMRVLDRVHVARAFTAWQHQSLVQDVAEKVTDDTVCVVFPAFDAFYRTDDLRQQESEEMLEDALGLVADLATETGCPILLSRTEADPFSEPIPSAATRRLACERTRLGPRFSSEEFETLVYPVEDGLVQTTLGFWTRVLSERHPAVTESGVGPIEVGARGSY